MQKLIAFVAAALLSTVAFAGGDKPGATMDKKSPSAAFESLDKNADQQISKTEAATDKTLSDSFATLDANGDGYLSKSEYTARTPRS